MTLTSQQLKDSTRCTQSNADKYLSSINATMAKYEINTPLRVAHYLAQIGHESMGFVYTREIASGEKYENRADLGNVKPGDGIRYKGRGLIQITGRANYRSYGDFIKFDIEDNSHLMGVLPYCVDSSGWFWDQHNLNIFADKNDILTITKRINGGTNGFADRKARLIYAKIALSITDPQHH